MTRITIVDACGISVALLAALATIADFKIVQYNDLTGMAADITAPREFLIPEDVLPRRLKDFTESATTRHWNVVGKLIWPIHEYFATMQKAEIFGIS